ncbi:MAG TPA: hypothetical protein VNY29_07900 [Terriglobales bacterium]|jgi:hypothetical protein|nr:hypothetical protein [Terriglobales bacterium]
MPIHQRFRVSVLAIGEWMMLLPATVVLAAAAVRLLQPRQYEPARTSWIIFDWATMHISRLGAAVLFAGIPGLVVVVGCTTLLRSWRSDPTLRGDAALGRSILRRNRMVAGLTTATLTAFAVLTFAVAHALTD